MPEYKLTVTHALAERSTIRVTGPYAYSDAAAIWAAFRNSYGHAFTAISHPELVDPAPADANQPDANRPVADSAGGVDLRGEGVPPEGNVGRCVRCGGRMAGHCHDGDR